MKITLIADTHTQHQKMTKDILDVSKDSNIIIHAGDIMSTGYSEYELTDFLNWYSSLGNFSHRILIAGNHDRFIENRPKEWQYKLKKYPNIIYLENTGIEIDGIKFYGAPQQPTFYNWAFNVDRGPKIKAIWDKIPNDTQVLITHGPPFSYGDEVESSYHNNFETNVGCKDLLNRINELPYLTHSIAGHLHGGYGVKTHKDGKNITFINAAMLDDNYLYSHKPIVIEV